MLPWLQIDHPEALEALSHVRDISLSQIVRNSILKSILDGQLQEGVRINEPEIAKRLGVSRVPVREALRELVSTGLLETRKHSGVFVRSLSEQEINELYELRGLLDGYAGQQAAARISDAQLSKLKSSISAMQRHAKAKNVQRYYAENLNFHWQIVQAAGNTQLDSMYQIVVQRLHVARLSNLSHLSGMNASIEEHIQILHALQDRDASLSQRLLTAHVHQARLRWQAQH